MCVVLCCAVLRFALRAWAVGLMSASGGDLGQGHHPVPIHVPGKVQRRHCGHHLWPCNLPGRCVRLRVRVRVCAHVAGTKDREVRWKGGGGGGKLLIKALHEPENMSYQLKKLINGIMHFILIIQAMVFYDRRE